MIQIETGALNSDFPTVLFDSVIARATLSSSVGLATGAALANVIGPQTFDYWKPAAMPATHLSTLAVAETCDCLAIDAHTLGSSGATLNLTYSVSGVSSFIALATHVPADDSPILILFPPATGMRWRMEVTGAVAPSIGIAMIGQKLVIPSSVRAPYVSTDAARKVDLMNARSMGGHFLNNSVYRQGIETEAQFNALPRSFTDGALLPFRRHFDAGGTFFWSASPAVFARDAAYCWRPEGASELRPAYLEGDYWADMKMGLAAYAA